MPPGRLLIAVLTGAVCRASKRSLIVWCAVSGQVPCSGAKRRDKVLDEVSTAILGGAAAENVWLTGPALFVESECSRWLAKYFIVLIR